MKVFHRLEDAAGKINRAVVTTGSFDGVHLGHKVIIGSLKQLAESIGGESVLITFHPHPRKVLYPEQTDLKLINSQEEKIALLSETGLDNLIIHPFSLSFSKTSSHDFVTRILIGQLRTQVIVVGHNHHFGYNREGDYSYLHALKKELGFGLEEIPLLDIENETVSSTRIRKALKEGNMQRANAYLDHPYVIYGPLSEAPPMEAVPDLPLLRTGIEEPDKLVPPPGIYASMLEMQGVKHKSMTFIGHRADGPQQVDTHVLEGMPMPAMNRAQLYLHKKIANSRPANHGGGFSREMVLSARENTDELIY